MKKKKVFLFDLDSTVSSEEILPLISKEINKEEEMKVLTEKTMIGEINFIESFLSRVELLKQIPVSKVQKIISNVSINEKILKFIQENKKNCYIVTSNLDVWIIELMKKINMEDHFFSSTAKVVKDKLVSVTNVLTKEDVVKNFDCEVIAIGDGSNDRNMLSKANISIGYGGVRRVSPQLIDVVDYVICDENTMYEFLKKICEE